MFVGVHPRGWLGNTLGAGVEPEADQVPDFGSFQEFVDHWQDLLLHNRVEEALVVVDEVGQ